MKLFARLYTALDETTSTNRKVSAMADYFQAAPAEDAIWAISFLIGRKPKQVVPTARLRAWAARLAQVPDWLFEASYDVVGDLAETITLLLPPSETENAAPLHEWVESRLLPLRDQPPELQEQEVARAWEAMSTVQRFVWNKLITGGFRVGVSQKLVTRALSSFSGIDEAVIAHRLMGNWSPTPAVYQAILSPDTDDADISRPYPFFLAYPLEDAPETLGPVDEWQAEWKWDGIRAQVIRRRGAVFVWSRGEELVTEKYPEIESACEGLPDGVALDGELLPWKDGGPLPFGLLQKRIGRKNLSPKILSDIPVVLLAYDLLELNGEDIREKDLSFRRERLKSVIAEADSENLMLSPLISANSWEALANTRGEARANSVEGLMLKRRSSTYQVGRKKGDWWKWKVAPLTVDAVLIYAQRGHGRRSGLYTDYTFAVWEGDELVPFAKAYSGLTDAEIRTVDRFIGQNTVERFGPVRSVKPELVFEIAFDTIQESTRHKSGVAVRFPRIARWRTDKTPEDADTLETVKALLHDAE